MSSSQFLMIHFCILGFIYNTDFYTTLSGIGTRGRFGIHDDVHGSFYILYFSRNGIKAHALTLPDEMFDYVFIGAWMVSNASLSNMSGLDTHLRSYSVNLISVSALLETSFRRFMEMEYFHSLQHLLLGTKCLTIMNNLSTKFQSA